MSTKMSTGYGPHFHIWVDGNDGTIGMGLGQTTPAKSAAVDCVLQEGDCELHWTTADEPERIAKGLLEAAAIVRGRVR